MYHDQGTDGAPGLWSVETLLPTVELLEQVAAKYKVGIVTGRPRPDAVRFLKQVLNSHFSIKLFP